MDTYIVDFGKPAIGGRYALIQAESLRLAEQFIDDNIADISDCKIKKLIIPEDDLTDGRYMEIDQPLGVYFGSKIKHCFKKRKT